MAHDLRYLWGEIYKSDQYKEFKRVVRKRDGYRCQRCNTKGTCNRTNRLHVHHVLPKAKFIGSMFDPANGLVLCNKCHIQEHREMAADGRDYKDRPSATVQQLTDLISKITFRIYDSYRKRRKKKYAYNKKSAKRTPRKRK